ncbi:unnamed protein product [Oppiella nova]|uniref:Bromodomain-containing protein 8 n=1 Tax=Oppiella nova TaxID=334625 RepID=A0A7R9LFW8_9ACAR|nr:unnamed protein product [Oppiella nova]CAG2163175.1 unnamed protein product [Oppiella nova]
MSVNSPSNLKSRLRVVPIDEWSTREKLCLASSVLKSGDQNWSSVSRPMKSFCEPNRPQDWYHQKYCAIQYQELLEKIETDTPKRKRSERGEETPQTVIVRNLTKQRIEELRQKTQMEREMIARVKRDLELLKTNQMDDKRVQELCSEIKEKEAKEKEREVEHKKWLEERNVKIAQMTRKGTFATRHKPSTPAMPVPSQTIANATVAESAVKSPLIEPLKVEVESDGNITQSTAQKQTVEKPAPVTPSPSTSPLLTSLLQSPTPSTPTLLSPTKSGLTNPFNRQKSSSPLTPISRRPSIHSTPEKTTESPLKSSDKNDLTVGNSTPKKRTISSKNKTKDSKKDSEKGEEVHKREESNERSLRSKDKTDESKGDKHLAEKTDDKEREKSVEKKPEETAENVSIKQEIMDALADEESQHKESGKPVVKEEPMDSTSSSVAEDSNQRTPLTRPNKRVRKTLTPLNITPTVTRRSSRRVALKDTKSANDDSTEVSDQSAANTPQAVKKRGSVDDTTETSMSEDSNDSKLRDRGRRSNAPIIATPVGPENEMSIRRKSRGASTDTDSNASSLTKSVTKKKKT